MDPAFDTDQWRDFAVACAGASAALAGLLVVAMSINLRQILSDRTLPPRAGGALIVVTTPLMIALVVLIPGASTTAVGSALLSTGVVSAVLLAASNWPTRLSSQRTLRQWFIGTAVPIVILVVPTMLAGLGVLVEGLGGLYWLPVAMAAAFIGGLAQAWVLLVEILR